MKMLRSLLALMAATFIGLATAKFIEGAGAALFSLDLGAANAGHTLPYAGVLIFAWTISAFVAAICALLIGRRWAPLGALAAATVYLSAIIALLSTPASILIWGLTAAGVAVGGWTAIKALGATQVYPANKEKSDFFDD